MEWCGHKMKVLDLSISLNVNKMIFLTLKLRKETC